MYDELIKQLREEASGWCTNCCYKCGDNACGAPDDRKKDCDIASKLQAADAIEQLQGEQAMIKKAAERLAEKVPKMIVIRTNLEKMPTTCSNCPLKVYDPQIVWKDALKTQWGGWACPISGQLIDNTKREESCPLEEISEPPKEET